MQANLLVLGILALTLPARLSAEEPDVAKKDIAPITYFAIGGVGFGGHTSPGEILFKALAKRKDALKQFEILYDIGHPEVQAYAGLAFFYLSKKRFAEIKARYTRYPASIMVMSGCTGMHTSMFYLMKGIEKGRYRDAVPEEWLKRKKAR